MHAAELRLPELVVAAQGEQGVLEQQEGQLRVEVCPEHEFGEIGQQEAQVSHVRGLLDARQPAAGIGTGSVLFAAVFVRAPRYVNPSLGSLPKDRGRDLQG